VSQKAEPDSIRADFGANEWLVDELYEQYLKDKNAVDPAWWDFFEGYKPGEQDATTNGNGAAPATDAPAAPRAQPTQVKEAPSKDEPMPAVPTALPPKPKHLPADPTASAATKTVDAEPTPVTSPVATAQPATAPYAEAALKATTQADEAVDDVQKLRGPAARVVTNMEASLEVPTATSVRAVPAKLMVDNRIVINNHLSRGRGGKISFTHLIGFALVEALEQMPAMNAAYTPIDGKPGFT